ncbi:hypothetical protein JG688_00017211, partial [Phytophthora aleatoria]
QCVFSTYLLEQFLGKERKLFGFTAEAKAKSAQPLCSWQILTVKRWLHLLTLKPTLQRIRACESKTLAFDTVLVFGFGRQSTKFKPIRHFKSTTTGK